MVKIFVYAINKKRIAVPCPVNLNTFNIMKKILLSVFILGAAAFSSFAQTTPSKGQFSIGVEAALPVGNASDLFSFGIGGSIKYDHPVAENLFITGSAGYTSFMYKDEFKDFLDKSAAGFIPVKVGAKYFFSPGFFGEAQVGAAFGTEDGAGTAFAYSPGIGYAFSQNFEAGVRYEAWSKDGTISQFGLRLAYKF